MKKVASILIVSLLAVALISAVLVPYLSNLSSVFVDVDSPLTTISKTSSEQVYGGETIHYKGSVTNNINQSVNGILTLTITNNKGSASCNDFDLMELEVEGEPSLVPIILSCSDDGMGVIIITKDVSYSPLESETYLGAFGLKLNIEPLTYRFDTQVVPTA